MTKTFTTEQLRWLQDAATEMAAVRMKMTMSPDDVLLLTTELLAAREAVPVYQMRVLDGSSEQNEWIEVTHREFNTPLTNPEQWQKRVLYTAPAPPTPVAWKDTLDMAASAIEDLLETADSHAACWADVPKKLRSLSELSLDQ